MSGLAVLPEPLAVVRGHHDHGVPQQAPGFERLSQPSDLPVDRGDLAHVGLAAVALRERGRRVVGRVGVEVVNEQQERGAKVLGSGQGRVGHLPRRSLRDGQAAARRLHVVVGFEAPVEPVLPIEDRGPHDRGGVVAGRGELLRQGRHVRGDPVDPVVAHAVPPGQCAGQDRRVRGQRDGDRRQRPLEHHPLVGPAVDVGGGRGLAPVASQVVGARGVDADEQDRRRPRRRLPRPARLVTGVGRSAGAAARGCEGRKAGEEEKEGRLHRRGLTERSLCHSRGARPGATKKGGGLPRPPLLSVGPEGSARRVKRLPLEPDARGESRSARGTPRRSSHRSCWAVRSSGCWTRSPGRS